MASIFGAHIFNSWARLLARSRPLASPTCRLDWTPSGTLISADEAHYFPHAWQLTLQAFVREDDPKRTEWRARVRPGFVNGRDVTITVQQDAQERHIPLTDDPAPWLPIRAWRNPQASGGLDSQAASLGSVVALPGEGFPAFFDTLGVKRPAKGGAITEPGAISAESTATATRQIRAADIFLTVPRLQTFTELKILDPFANQRVLELSTSYGTASIDRAKASGTTARLGALPRWEAQTEPSLLDRLRGIYVEPQTDELKLATVWMLSPPDAPDDAEPDMTWTPYPQYFVWFNLMHAARRPAPEKPFQAIRYVIPLLAGFAQPIVDSILTPINDAFAEIHSAFQDASYKGEFWSI